MNEQIWSTIDGVKTRLGVLALALAACAAVPAVAGTATFGVSATIAKECTVSAANLDFGAYTPGAGADAASSQISVNCTSGMPFTVALGAGTTSGATISNREMVGSTKATDLLNYQLYTDSAHTTVWGDGTGGTSTSAQTGQGMAAAQAQAMTVYGQIPDTTANQDAATDTYSDTITVSVSY
ncbi:spore coat protein U domain protein [mine drainage metagenome]|uniref:Spore coat protein U domain protein n=1 Tax=mine drainage metagenome TaxID=410659 RepID=A0A1J5QW11_9ZZZZ